MSMLYNWQLSDINSKVFAINKHVNVKYSSTENRLVISPNGNKRPAY